MKPDKFDPKEKNDKSETPRTVGKKNRDMRDAKITQKESSRPIKKASVIRDQAKIFQDPRFLRYHSLPLPVDRISIARSQGWKKRSCCKRMQPILVY